MLRPVPAGQRVEAVLDQLTQAIFDSKMKPGSLLPGERELARTLAVSRSVVREALRTLQSRGLVEIRQGLGAVVTDVSSEPMQHLLSGALRGNEEGLVHLTEVRLLIEVKMAEWAAERATPDNVAQLQKLHDEMALNFKNNERYVELDIEFHLELARATQNPLFALMLESVSTLQHKSRELALAKFPVKDQPSDESSAEFAYRTHGEILEAVISKNATAAAAAMSEHLNPQRGAAKQTGKAARRR
jgi:DNA-binding FadR family transcriptional regulator